MSHTLTAANFSQNVLESDVPVLVDFWAPWCGPCRALSPALEALSAASGGRYEVGKVNVDDHGELAARYGVNALPTLMVFHKGQVVRTLVGLQSKSTLESAVLAHAGQAA